MVKKKLDQVVYEYIVDGIENGDILEREHITEQYIADQLEISRTPVRKAFERLVTEEYLENIANVGVRVKSQKLTSLGFQNRMDFFERLANHYLFDLEKKEIIFEVEDLLDLIKEMEASLIMEQDIFEDLEMSFWKNILQYDTNTYTQKILLKTIKESLAEDGYIHEILQNSRSLKLNHFKQLAEYLETEEYSLARREIRILLNQLKLNVIEMGQYN